VNPYAHPQHIKVLKHIVCILYGCGLQSEASCSLNHDTTSSFGFAHTPIFSKFGPQREYLTEKLTHMLQIAHKNTSNGSIGVYDMQFNKVQHFVRVFGTITV
jgi:hypothetical protein